MAEIPKSSQGSADAMRALLAEKRAILEKYHVSNEDMAKILEVSGGSETIHKTFPVGEPHVDVPIKRPCGCKYGGVSLNGGFPQQSHGVFLLKMISTWGGDWGYHHLRKHPYMSMILSLPLKLFFPQSCGARHSSAAFIRGNLPISKQTEVFFRKSFSNV